MMYKINEQKKRQEKRAVILSIFIGVTLSTALTFLLASHTALAETIFPLGNNNNMLYYKIGGGSDYALPPVNSTSTINLDSGANLGAGYSCGAYNPALSIANDFNNLKDSAQNIPQTILNNATGSLAEMPMYWLSQASPAAYNALNNEYLGSQNQLGLSVKSCEEAKSAIANGQDPYKSWATLSVDNEWKKSLDLTAIGKEDINYIKSKIDKDGGNDGVQWVQGAPNKSGAGYDAGGLDQPPIHVIADTVKAGYNAMLMRDLNSNDPAPVGSELANLFPTPTDAQTWITNVVGDQIVTTCHASSCTSQDGGISGIGLLPWITTCNATNQNYCAPTIQANLINLVTGKTSITKENLKAVSASGLVISPQVISAIRSMNPLQQNIVVAKLAQEVSIQKVIDRALIAWDILQTGSQVPVIASNSPAQKIIKQKLSALQKDIQSIAFDAKVRKQLMSSTVSNILNYQANQENAAMNVPKVNPTQPLVSNSAIKNKQDEQNERNNKWEE